MEFRSNVKMTHLTDVWIYGNLNPLIHKLQPGSHYFFLRALESCHKTHLKGPEQSSTTKVFRPYSESFILQMDLTSMVI